MNHKSYYHYQRINLPSRSEGKIKSYESCFDLRAWSHDIEKKDDYLREWIKSDMPIGIVPAKTLSYFIRSMTNCNKGNVTPRCHPDCKSKIVLDSICKSCRAIRECFKNKESFESYFNDEEFETSHWPCDKCLEAFKSIKMFWRVIVEKLFTVNVTTKGEDAEPSSHTTCGNSVHSIAKAWQREMMQQAMYVKNLMPHLNLNNCAWKRCLRRDTSSCDEDFSANGDSEVALKDSKYVISTSCKTTNTSALNIRKVGSHKPIEDKISKQILVKFPTADIGCECLHLNDEITIYKDNLEIIQGQFETQQKEIEKLRKENGSLKTELQSAVKNSFWKPRIFSDLFSTSDDSRDTNVEGLPIPFEGCPSEDNYDADPLRLIDSEMVITMKKCKDESFRHVSILEVLHKTNAPGFNDLNDTCCKREDPIELLTKAQKKFGAIVNREMSLATNRSSLANSLDISAVYHQISSRQRSETGDLKHLCLLRPSPERKDIAVTD